MVCHLDREGFRDNGTRKETGKEGQIGKGQAQLFLSVISSDVRMKALICRNGHPPIILTPICPLEKMKQKSKLMRYEFYYFELL